MVKAWRKGDLARPFVRVRGTSFDSTDFIELFVESFSTSSDCWFGAAMSSRKMSSIDVPRTSYETIPKASLAVSSK